MKEYQIPEVEYVNFKLDIEPYANVDTTIIEGETGVTSANVPRPN